MGKKKSDIYSCFEILPMKNKANKSIFMCKFCDRQYLQNATKMESHIVTQCQKVPQHIRIAYAKVPPGQQQQQQQQQLEQQMMMTRPSPSLSSDNSSVGKIKSKKNNERRPFNFFLSFVESRPETPVNLKQAQRPSQFVNNNNNNNYYTSSNTSSSSQGGTSLVIKRGAGGTLVSDIVVSSSRQQQQIPNKKPKLENNSNSNNVITLNVNALRNAIAQNNNNINNLNLTKYVQNLQQKQQKQQNCYVKKNKVQQQSNNNNNNNATGIHINPKHMVPTGMTNKGGKGGGGNHHHQVMVQQQQFNRGASSSPINRIIGNSSSNTALSSMESFPKTFNHKELVRKLKSFLE
jgi:hypothetical protein